MSKDSKGREATHIIVEKAKHNYSAYSPDIPGCVATGKNVGQTYHNFVCAMHMHMEQEERQPKYETAMRGKRERAAFFPFRRWLDWLKRKSDGADNRNRTDD